MSSCQPLHWADLFQLQLAWNDETQTETVLHTSYWHTNLMSTRAQALKLTHVRAIRELSRCAQPLYGQT